MEFSIVNNGLTKSVSATATFIAGIITMGADLELVGSLLLILAFIIALIGLLPLILKGLRSSSPLVWKAKQGFFFLTSLGLIAIVGITEALEGEHVQVELALIFAVLLISSVFYSYRYLKRKQVQIQFFLLGVAIGIGLVLINDEYSEQEEYIIALFIYFSGIILLLLNWIFIQIKSILKLKNEQKNTEIIHLQSQVNPHFFFNILNNLYGLVEVDAKKAQALILKLSDLMRYSIYDGQKRMVRLADEIEYLENFIALHKMRYYKEIEVKFDKDISDTDVLVMPLMFINLVENAFKHGVEHLRKDAFVHLKLNASEKELHFEIKNNFDSEEVSKEIGIGIANLKRRLQLIYPDNHQFETKDEGNIYSVKMSVEML